MPRSGSESGYDPMPVCSFCIENLTRECLSNILTCLELKEPRAPSVTAAGKTYLKTLPLSRLKKYANAYNIKVNGILEKDELLDAIMSARVCYDHVISWYFK